MRMGQGGAGATAPLRGLAAGGTEVRTPTEADIRLLWSASRLVPSAEQVAADAAGADVVYVLETAARQRVAPLFLHALALAGVDVSGADSWAIAQADAWQAHGCLAVPRAAAAALEPLCAEGFEPLLLKGLSLVERYPSRGLRPMDDIDLLLPRRDAERATRVLERAGWRRVGHTGREPGYDRAFRHPDAPGVPLELHYDFAEWRERPPALEGVKLWRARRPTTVFGRTAWTLPPEIELVALIAHAAKGYHLFNRLLWMVDLVAIAQTCTVDWDEVARLSDEAHRRVATSVALTQARRLGAGVPEALTTVPEVLARTGALDSLLDPARPFLLGTSPRWLAYVLTDDFGSKVRLATGDLLRPHSNKSRRQVIGDLARMAAHGAPELLRARLGRARR
jgi:putative nucleotidyltransferase-like protein